MAKKRSLDFKGLLLSHVEKLACGVIVLCFGFLLWAAFSRPGVEPGLEPADISFAAEQAKINITKTTWEDFSDKPQMRNFAQESGWYDVPTAPYMLSIPWDPPVFPKQDLRDDPKYYPLQELEAHFDQGPLALLKAEKVRAMFNPPQIPVPPAVEVQLEKARKAPEKQAPVAQDPNKIVEGAAAGPVKIDLPGAKVEELEVSEGRRWVMVKGLLPWQEQIDAYVDKFRNAAGYDQKNDLPLYFGYEVERADVTGGVTPEWQPHEKIHPLALQYATIRWAANKRTEIIAKPNRDPIFTWPLPPRVLELWGTRDKHSKIPLESAAKEREVQARVPMAQADPLGGLGEVMEETAPAENANHAAAQISHKMLRYFDFDVLPGRAYQYRFRAALRDPNYVREGTDVDRSLRRVELKLLEERVVNRINEKRAALEKEGVAPEMIERYMPVVYTDWSDPSPTVKIPPDVYVLALQAELPPEGRYNVEPSVSLLVTKYDAELGIEVGAETKKLQRGNIANFSAEGIRVINVDHSTLETRQVSFTTKNMLLDIRGGETVAGSGLTAPTEVLIFNLDQGGRLVVADEVEDAQSVITFRQRKAQVDKLIPRTDGNTGGGVIGPRDTDIIR